MRESRMNVGSFLFALLTFGAIRALLQRKLAITLLAPQPSRGALQA
jgi:hypothetical protein